MKVARRTWALPALVVVSALALAYDGMLVALAHNSENVESPNQGYAKLAVGSAIAFALGLLGLRRRWARVVVVAFLLVPLIAAIFGSTLETDTGR